MSNLFTSFLIVIGVGIIILLIWNIALYKSKSSKRKNSEEYIELKYQQQFYIAVFAAIIAVASFMGYDKYNEMEDKIVLQIENKTKSEVNSYKKEMESLTTELKYNQKLIVFENDILRKSNEKLDNQTQTANKQLFDLMYHFSDMRADLDISQQEVDKQIQKVKGFNNDIEELKKLDFLRQIHLVTNRKFKSEFHRGDVDTVSFKEVKTINGLDLPNFKHPPSIIISKASRYNLFVESITTEFYVVRAGNGAYGRNLDGTTEFDGIKYDLLIIYRESD